MYDIRGIGTARSAHRWGIVLAGGDGTRLRDTVYRKRGDHLPKQYINFIGKRSMLEHTLERAERLIPAPNILTVIAREHLKYAEVNRQIAARPQECIIVQPENKDTLPGMLLPLMHLDKRNPAANCPRCHGLNTCRLVSSVTQDAIGTADEQRVKSVKGISQPLEPKKTFAIQQRAVAFNSQAGP